MTIEEFRSSEVNVGMAREHILHPEMQRILSVVQAAKPVLDAPVDFPEVASVRLLSRLHGYNEAIANFLSLTEPLKPVPEMPKEDYGTNLSQSDIPDV